MAQSFRDFFSAQAASYTAFRPRYPRALYEFLIAHVPNRRAAWDVGTGNGQAAIDLAEFFDAVIATDASAAQIDRAFAHAKISYAVAPAERSGLADGAASLVTAAQCLHWFAGPKFFAEVARVLCKGGMFATWAYGFHASGDPALDALLTHFAIEILGDFWQPEPKLIWDDYRGIDIPFAPIATPALSLDVAWNLRELVGYFSSWSATQKFIEARGVHPVETIFDELRARWGDPEIARTLRCPLVFRAGRRA